MISGDLAIGLLPGSYAVTAGDSVLIACAGTSPAGILRFDAPDGVIEVTDCGGTSGVPVPPPPRSPPIIPAKRRGCGAFGIETGVLLMIAGGRLGRLSP